MPIYFLLDLTSSKDITLLNAINRIFDIITNNPFYGENAKKDLIPKEYMQKYDADNLFIVDLPDSLKNLFKIFGAQKSLAFLGIGE